MKILISIFCVIFIADHAVLADYAQQSPIKQNENGPRRHKVKKCFPITNSTTISTTPASTSTTTASWPTNYELQQEITKGFLEFAPQLSQSQLQEFMNTFLDMNSHTQFWTSSQVSTISTLNAQIVINQATSHNTSNPPSSITFTDELKQQITSYILENDPNISSNNIMDIISILETMSTISLKYLTLDQLTQLTSYVVSSFTNNTITNGFISTTSASTSTTTASWPTNYELQQEITKGFLEFAPQLSQSQLQEFMNTFLDMNSHTQFWTSSQVSTISTLNAQIVINQATSHNTSNPPSSITFTDELKQQITSYILENDPNISSNDIMDIISILETMSTISLKYLTLDRLTKLTSYVVSSFTNNTITNGFISTTSASTSTTTASWPTNYELQQKITKGFLEFAPQLSQSQLQEFMNTFLDMNSHTQFWTSSQVSTISTLNAQIVINQVTSHNTSNPPSSITFTDELKQQITSYILENDPNISSNDIMDIISILETMSTISLKYLTLDQLTQLTSYVVSSFTNNTITNGFISTTSASTSTTTASWPTNYELQQEITKGFLEFAPQLSQSQLQEFMNTFLDMNSHTQFWTSSQVSTISTLNAQIVINQATSHNTSNPPSSITFTDELKQQITSYILENDPNISSNDIMDIISILETMSTISLKYLTLDQLTQLTSYVVSSFTNNTITNGFISTTSASTSTTTASWPTNYELQQEITKGFFEFAPQLSQSQLQEFMNTFLDMNSHTQFWTSSQVSTISTLNAQIVINQATSHNTSNPPSSITFTDELKQQITSYILENDPNISSNDIMDIISILETMSTISLKYLTLDQLTQLTSYVVSSFTNNTITNGFISTTSASTSTTTASWPTNYELQQEITKGFLEFAPQLSQSQLQEFMNTFLDMNSHTQFWTSSQVSTISTLNAQIVINQATSHNTSNPPSSITFTDELKQQITSYILENDPNISSNDIMDIISILETMSTISLKYLTLDQLTQLTSYVVSSFTNNTITNGFISTTSASTSTTTASWPTNYELQQEITKGFLEFAPQLSQSQLQEFMNTFLDMNSHTQFWTSSQVSTISTLNAQIVINQATSHNTSNPPSSITFTDELKQQITSYILENDPNISSNDIMDIISILETMSTISLKYLTLDQLTQLTSYVVSSFTNNTITNGFISTTSASTSTTTASWPTNYELQQEITKGFLEFAPQLSQSQLQEFMNTFLDMNSHTQFWTSSQVSTISTLNAQIVINQATSHNASNPPSSITFTDELKQQITSYILENDPNISSNNIMDIISILETMSTISMKYLTLDQLTQLTSYVVSSFTNNTITNGFISTTSASISTTTASWPTNYELQQEITKGFLEFAPQLSQSQLQEFMNTFLDMNSHTQFWTSSQVSTISTLNAQIVINQATSHNTSNPPSSITFTDELKQQITSYILENDPNISSNDIMDIISILETMSTISMKYLTLDQLTQLTSYVVSSFTNNTITNGFISTTSASISTTTASWPTNYELQQEITKGFLEFAPQLSQSQLQEFMNTFLDMNSHTQFWTSSQVSTISTLNAQIVINQATSHNTSNPPSSITFTDELKQQITSYILENDPNISSNDIMDIISILETMSTISLKYLTLDRLTQLTSYVVSSFTNNTITNGFISTTSASTSTTTASWPTNYELQQEITKGFLEFAPQLSQSQLQEFMNTFLDMNSHTQFWTSSQVSTISTLNAQIVINQATSHNTSNPPSSITFTDELKQQITSYILENDPNISSNDIMDIISILETMSTISLKYLTLDQLTQLTSYVVSSFTNNTITNGFISTTSASTSTTTASWPTNYELQQEITKGFLEFAPQLSQSQLQEFMNTFLDMNSHTQFWTSSQVSTISTLNAQIVINQATSHNTSNPPSSITFTDELKQQITSYILENDPNISSNDIMDIISILETMSTISLKYLTLDQLTQLTSYVVSSFTNNTITNGFISTTSASTSTTTASWPTNYELQQEITKGFLEFAPQLSQSQLQEFMNTFLDMNSHTQFWTSSQVSTISTLNAQIVINQATSHNTSNPPSSITFTDELKQQITSYILENDPNISSNDIMDIISILETMSTISLKYLTLDRLTQLTSYVVSSFTNNTITNGFISTTSASTSTTTASWPTNYELQQEITKGFLEFAPQLSQSQLQEFMNTFLDMNSHTQFWTSSQVSTISTLNAQIVINQATSHNTSNPPSSITFTDELKQQITSYILENDPNISSNDIMDIISILETMSTISLKYLTLDQLTQLTSYVVSSFTNNTITNGFISTTSASTSTTTASWPTNYELQQEITKGFLEFAPQLSQSQLQEFMNTFLDMNSHTQFWTSSQVSTISTLNAQIVINQATSHNTSNPPSSITFTDELKQQITSYILENDPNISSNDIMDIISILETMSTISLKYLTLDQLTQLTSYVVSSFTNNTITNGFISTTSASTSTTTASWPTNYELQQEITKGFLEFAPQLSQSQLQEFMNTFLDMNSHTQFWTSSQVSTISTLNAQIVINQATSHNTSNPPSSIIFTDELKQQITSYILENDPNISSNNIMDIISILETMSTISMKYLTLDQLTQLTSYVVSSFTNNTITNGFISTTSASTSTTTSSSSSTSSTTTAITASTLSPAINQQISSTLSQLAPNLSPTQIQNLLTAIETLYQTFYFTPLESIIVSPGLGTFYLTHSGPYVVVSGTTAAYTDADKLSITSFFNVWVPRMTASEIQLYIINMQKVSYYSQSITALEALALAPAIAQIFTNQANSQTTTVKA
ncbi:hypothetical protein ACKWTF_003211 [Chironomus riparius]